MLSTKYLYEISDINKSRLGVAGRAALVGGAGFAAYHALKGNDVEKPEKPEKTRVPPEFWRFKLSPFSTFLNLLKNTEKRINLKNKKCLY